MQQMAKRMRLSVVGLPHYTIWHLYEPSVDDLRHMEEMEQERRKREAEEQAKQDKLNRIREEFGETDLQWQEDKEQVNTLAKEQAAKVALGKVSNVEEQGNQVQREVGSPGNERVDGTMEAGEVVSKQ